LASALSTLRRRHSAGVDDPPQRETLIAVLAYANGDDSAARGLLEARRAEAEGDQGFKPWERLAGVLVGAPFALEQASMGAELLRLSGGDAGGSMEPHDVLAGLAWMLHLALEGQPDRAQGVQQALSAWATAGPSEDGQPAGGVGWEKWARELARLALAEPVVDLAALDSEESFEASDYATLPETRATLRCQVLFGRALVGWGRGRTEAARSDLEAVAQERCYMSPERYLASGLLRRLPQGH